MGRVVHHCVPELQSQLARTQWVSSAAEIGFRNICVGVLCAALHAE